VIKLNQSVALERYSPLQWTPDIRAGKLTVNSHDRVRKSGNRETTKSSPQEWCRRYVPTREFGAWRAQGIANQNCATRAESSAEEEVEPGAVGGGGANGSIAACYHVAFLIIPFEHDVPMPARHGDGRKRAIGREHAFERSRRRRASHDGQKENRSLSHLGSTFVI
jgi:hypothetical protein